MYALLIAQNPDERAVLSLTLQRAGVAVTTGHDLERAMNSWFERPADLILLAVPGDPVAHMRRVRSDTEVPIVAIVGREPICSVGGGWLHQMHTFLLPVGTDPEALQTALRESDGIEVPVWLYGEETILRISAQGYNRIEDYERLATALKKLLGRI